MSLVTTCPDCGTSFIVKTEHLTARRGDVCCGKCGFIFNALDHLAETAAQDEPVATPTPEEPHETAVDAYATEVPESVDEETVAEPAPADAIDAMPETTTAFAEESHGTELMQLSASEAGVQEASLETAVIAEPSALMPEAAVEEVEQPAELLPAAEPEPQEEAASEPKIKFELLEPEPKRRFSSLMPGVLVFLLLFACLGQSVYFLRIQLAAQYPHAKPLLLQLCNLLGCTVELPQHAELLAIDESDLQQDADHENVVVLSSMLINRAHYAQAYPALEVTLTDANDHPLLRRIFRPDEYLPKDTDLRAGMQADADIHVKLHLATGDIKATGYRVYVLYL
ncbi:MAG: DUF3426 domain-containing protein [Nitrosomonadales bacterium]|nr:MAG: DUF3426 domain-containing protein [Nitrosomonadales bacterium]